MAYKSVDYQWVFFTRIINRAKNRYWNHEIIVEAEDYDQAFLQMKYLAEDRRYLVLGINKVVATPISAKRHDGKTVWRNELENPPAAKIPAVLHMEYKIKDAKRDVHRVSEADLDAVIKEADEKRKKSWEELQQDVWYRVNRMDPDYWEHKYKKLVELKALIDERPAKKEKK